MTILTDSPADLIQSLLVAESQGSQPPQTPWPVYINRTPDGALVARELITVYDTEPRQDGRLMVGVRIEHPGFQIRVRSLDYATGFRKISNIAFVLDKVRRRSVGGNSASYLIHAITRTSGPIPLGSDDEGRESFTLNATATITENL